jgi:uncharacterized protein (DUF302 family)
MELDYTVQAQKPHTEAVQAVIDSTHAHGFKVQYVHDVAETLAVKGFHRDPVTIVEMCNAEYASKVLEKDVRIALMLPCPIVVYDQGDETFIATMRPTLIGAFFPEADIGDVADQVEQAIVAVIDEAAA